jgi:hypothetical protein
MVFDHEKEHASQWSGVRSIAEKMDQAVFRSTVVSVGHAQYGGCVF